MRTRPFRLAGGLLVAVVVVACQTVSITPPTFDDIRLKPGPGSWATETNCTLCHSLDYITTQPPISKARWRGVVDKMIKVYGAPIDDEETEAIVNYLATEYGPAH